MLVVALALGALGLGFVLGKGGDTRTAVASIASSHSIEAAPAVAPSLPAQPAPAAAPVIAVAAGSAAPTVAPPPSPTPPPTAAPEPSAKPAAVDAPLLLLRNASSDKVIELHPFAAGGNPSASAFQSLETLMACGDGHHEAPDPALVRVLLEAQHEFDKPLVMLGGRCARHDDHPEAIDHHRAGRGADVQLRDVPSEALMSWLVKRGIGGAGHYKHRGGFVHIDVRPAPFAQWEGKEPAAKPIAKPEADSASPSNCGSAESPRRSSPRRRQSDRKLGRCFAVARAPRPRFRITNGDESVKLNALRMTYASMSHRTW